MNQKLTLDSDWRECLGAVSQKLVLERGRILLCIMGRTGTGKSTLGKQIRKTGLPGVPASRIAVVDDSVLSVSWLFGLINFRVRRPSKVRDELAAFASFLRHKQLVVYVNSNPLARVSRCDILLHLTCDEAVRRQRLIARNSDGEERYQKSVTKGDLPLPPADYVFELDVT